MKIPKAIRGAIGLAAMLMACASAEAQLFRAYVASYGQDSNQCIVAAPCRLLPAALDAVADGGEIWILDSANYNTATVSVAKSVTILAIPGAVGSVLALNGGPAILLATPGTKVALRNLVVTKLLSNPGTHGVEMTNGDELTVENCNFFNLVNDGIQASGNGRARVSGSVFSGNNVGIRAYGNIKVDVSDSRFFDNGYSVILADGIVAGTAIVNASDVVVTASQFGLIAWSKVAASNVQIYARRATVTGTLEGVVAYMDAGTGSTLVGLAGSRVTGNDTGLVQFGATSVLKVFVDNQVSDNAFDTSGTLTTVARR